MGESDRIFLGTFSSFVGWLSKRALPLCPTRTQVEARCGSGGQGRGLDTGGRRYMKTQKNFQSVLKKILISWCRISAQGRGKNMEPVGVAMTRHLLHGSSAGRVLDGDNATSWGPDAGSDRGLPQPLLHPSGHQTGP